MTLADQAASILKRHQDLGSLQQRRQEFDALHQRKESFEGGRDQLLTTLEWVSHLRTAGVAISIEANQATSARVQLTELRSAFAESRSSRDLTAGNRWPRLQASFAKVANALSQAAEDAWQDFKVTQLSFEAPENIKPRLPLTPENERALRTYQAEYTALSQELRMPASRRPPVQQMLRRAETLRRAIADMKHDCPPAITAFLAAVSTTTGVSLAQLTPEVLDWLRENELLGRYVVRLRV